MSSEFDFISWICAQQRATELVPVPAGDDLAILKWDAADLLLVGTDQVLDGVHFDSKIHSAKQIGRKAMNRNLSDCAAMACLPAAAVATVALARGTSMEYARQLYQGIAEAADAFACPIVGGDTASWDGRLVVTVSILGRSAGIEPVRRNGARSGDFVYVTGALGGSLLGRHMTFEPRIALARQLVSLAPVNSMIDLSDGLSRDLQHICRQSGVGAVVWADQIPIHEDAVSLGMRDGTPPLEHALHDGEDHELLLTSPHELAPSIARRIGRIVAEPGIWLEQDGKRRPLEPRGWEHTF